MWAKISGANLLPFGLLTGVPAGAPAAGAIGLPGMVKADGDLAGKSGFETELGAFAEKIAGEEGAGAENAEIVSGSFAVPLEVDIQQVKPDIGIAPGGGGQPDLPAVPAGPEDDIAAPDDPVAVPAAASSTVAGMAREASAAPVAGAAAAANVAALDSRTVPAAGPAPSGATVPTVESVVTPASDRLFRNVSQPVANPVVPPQGAPQSAGPIGGRAPAGAAVQTVVASRVEDAVEGEFRRNRPDLPARSAKVSLPAAPSQGAATVPELSAEPVKTVSVQAPLVEGASAAAFRDVAGPSASARTLLVENDGETAAQSKPVMTESAALPPVKQVVRRWQSELPSELRAPALTPVQSVAPTRQEISSAAPVSAEAGAHAISTSQAQAARPISPASAEVDVSDAVAKGPAPAINQGVKDSKNGVETGVTRIAAAPAVSETAEKPVSGPPQAQAVSQPSGVAVVPKVPAQGQPEPVPALEEAAADPVLPEEEAATKDVKSSQVGVVTERAAESRSRPVGTEAIGKVAAGGTEPRTAGGTPVAAAFLASQFAAEEFQPGGQPLDASLGTEFGATVRGGDGMGAMRTESLQVPTQAQAGQVATQVAAEIARNLKNGQTRFQMRFDPPELGRVEVNMRVGADGGVHAHLIVERPETLDMFLRDQRGLERALEAAGLNADSENLQFSLKQDGSRDFASDDGQSDQSAETDQGQEETEPEDAEDIVRMTLASRPGGLDLKI
ncbi:flagellar hook-length control protein FliK [Labrenzia sp. DG1229]|uniref:flagellar hook-length control protein FliK n=1 Tax=Labrenzia sp. DG1229 TaxID=681847 RepID=UPI00048A55D8|nr:flagellar hook-length control protein FliK [Labrenzia sp. DG1229]